MMLKKSIILLFAFSFVLTACNSPVYNQAEANVADNKLKAQDARVMTDLKARTQPAMVVRNGLYVDTTPISLAKEPAWLKNRIVVRGDALPFSFYSRTIASGAGPSVLTKYQTGLDQAVNISVNYTGTVRGALDLLAARTGYVYTIKDCNIYWQAFITRTFDIAFMPGSSDYLMGKASGASGANTGQQASSAQVSNYVSTDDSSSEFSNLKATLSIWKDLESTITPLLSPEGKVVVSESTTSVTVRDRPSNVSLVGQYIANLNKHLSKQVLVKIQVIDVALQNDFDFGINWGLIANAFNKSPFVFNGNYGTPITIKALTTQAAAGIPQFGTKAQIDPSTGLPYIPSYTILFNALNQQGKASIVSEPQVVCLNNQVGVVRVVKSEGYAASVQNTSLAGTSSTGGTTTVGTVTSQITPGLVTTGLTLYILPKIFKNKVYLQVNVDLSTNDGFQIFGPQDANGQVQQQIQLPNITEKHFNQRSMIRTGDTLVLSGFRQLANVANANQFLTYQALGGKGASELNRETIVLITPIILGGNF